MVRLKYFLRNSLLLIEGFMKKCNRIVEYDMSVLMPPFGVLIPATRFYDFTYKDLDGANHSNTHRLKTGEFFPFPHAYYASFQVEWLSLQQVRWLTRITSPDSPSFHKLKLRLFAQSRKSVD